ncbi:hypothetical protein GCK72_024897 [Caenorhabditis remanei]|uniref:Uncharacterized protein n=1 Tax=Caenorhabditis remanei TaxID=31234 RepID=A0A6A5G0H4_CAERE|nr:hypothetical protein GCK72_024897 [Caenorhabditis remanei]KAF1748430.1 hypothetical protein GCK72_024897 [Caenorhabditis remanei]
MREENRTPIQEWSNGEFKVSDVIAQGELFCRYYISFADDPVNTVRGFEVDLKIIDVQVIDVLTGEEYPVIIRGHNFVSYYTGDDIKGTRYVTVRVKHTGCIPHPKTCYAETYIATSFGRYNQDNRFPTFATNLATASYEKHCSWMRRLFNFWPLSHFF